MDIDTATRVAVESVRAVTDTLNPMLAEKDATIAALRKRVEELEGALEPLVDEFGSSIEQYDRIGPDWTHKDGTEVFEVSTLLDRRELIDRARALLRATGGDMTDDLKKLAEAAKAADADPDLGAFRDAYRHFQTAASPDAFLNLIWERDEARKQVNGLRLSQSLDKDSAYVIRELLNRHNVPAAAFIDDHVANAIAQRDAAEASLASVTKEVERLRAARAWHDGSPPNPRRDEWFIAETTDGDRVVIRSLPEDWHFNFTTAGQTYLMASKIKRWMRFPDSHFIEPEALTKEPPHAE